LVRWGSFSLADEDDEVDEEVTDWCFMAGVAGAEAETLAATVEDEDPPEPLTRWPALLNFLGGPVGLTSFFAGGAGEAEEEDADAAAVACLTSSREGEGEGERAGERLGPPNGASPVFSSRAMGQEPKC